MKWPRPLCLAWLLLGARPVLAQDSSGQSQDSSNLLLQLWVDDRTERLLSSPALRFGSGEEVQLHDDGKAPDSLAGDHMFTGEVRLKGGQATQMSLIETGFGSPFTLGSGTVELPKSDRTTLTLIVPPSGTGAFQVQLGDDSYKMSETSSAKNTTTAPAKQDASSTAAAQASDAKDAKEATDSKAAASSGGASQGGSSNASDSNGTSSASDPWPFIIAAGLGLLAVRYWLGQWYRTELRPFLSEARRWLIEQGPDRTRAFQVDRFIEAIRVHETAPPLAWQVPRPVLVLGGTAALQRALGVHLALEAASRGASVVLAGPEHDEWVLARRVVTSFAPSGSSPRSMAAAEAARPQLEHLERRSASGSWAPEEAVRVARRLAGTSGRALVILEELPRGSGDPAARLEAALSLLGAPPEGVDVVWLMPDGFFDAEAMFKVMRGGGGPLPLQAVSEWLSGVGALREGEGTAVLELALGARDQRLAFRWTPPVERLVLTQEATTAG